MRGSVEEVRARLVRELEQRDGNVRSLARQIADAAGVTLETARRAIYRVINESRIPTPATSQMLERGLGKSEGYFTVSRPRADRGWSRDRLGALEGEVAELRAALLLAGTAHDALQERVASLEAAALRRGRARRVASTRGGGAK